MITLLLPLVVLLSDASPIRILFLGDSLTAGYGLKPDESHPKIVERELLNKGVSVSVINGGVSGDTTAGGLRRIEWMLKSQPDVVLVALGANDMLRGIPVTESFSNLSKIIEILKAKNKKVVLLGMKALPNYGPAYEREFNSIYEKLSKKFSVPLMEFYIESVAGKSEFNLKDGIHPNREGQRRIAEDLMKFLEPILKKHLSK